MVVRKGQKLELEIKKLAFGGKGIAWIEGLTVFVDHTVPGDRVIAKAVKRKKSYAEARVTEFIEFSKDRLNAPCLYSGTCGGCKIQFLKYSKQLWYKERHVIESLAHIGMQKDLVVHSSIASDRIFEYRNKMEFTCSDRRWRLHDEMVKGIDCGGMAVGLHVPGTFYKILDIEKCLLQPDLGNQILSTIREYIRNSAEPIYNLHNHIGFWRFIMLRHSAAKDLWMVNIVTSAENRKVLQPLADLLCKTYPSVYSVVNNITAKKAGVTVGEREILLNGEKCIVDCIGPYEFEISANSFFQTNTHSAALLYDVVRSYADLNGSEVILDLYCGTGTIAIYLADMARSILGIDIVSDAVADAKRNCHRNQVENCRFICADVKSALLQLNFKPDVMIIDPPRVGMHKDVVQLVLELASPKIVYVSCNPATLARDIALLKEMYNVVEVQPVDMFPHTFHIEVVTKLKLK
jgi:23S rRNA (uracil1939-C5)-methyltransferase